MTRISERELILPALYILVPHDSLSTSELIVALTALLQPTGEDMRLLSGRNDTKFSQKVRNLKAHHTLSSLGFAVHTRSGFSITDEGRRHVEQRRHELDVLFNFRYGDMSAQLRQLTKGQPVVVLDERIITEGELRSRTVEYRTRSRQLRDAVIETYTSNGRIMCLACGFEFAAAYPDLGDGYIQVHHLKPVSFMRGEELSLTEALANVRPLCANCHQMVHREHPPLPIEDLRSCLSVTYNYGS